MAYWEEPDATTQPFLRRALFEVLLNFYCILLFITLCTGKWRHACCVHDIRVEVRGQLFGVKSHLHLYMVPRVELNCVHVV